MKYYTQVTIVKGHMDEDGTKEKIVDEIVKDDVFILEKEEENNSLVKEINKNSNFDFETAQEKIVLDKIVLHKIVLDKIVSDKIVLTTK